MHSPPAPVSLDPVMPFVCPPLCQAQDPKGQIQNPFYASDASKLLFGLTSQLVPYPCQSPWLLQLRTAPPFSHSCPAYIRHTSKHLLAVQATCKTFLCLSPSLPTEVQSQPSETKSHDPPPHCLSWAPTTLLNSFRVRMYPWVSTAQPFQFC